MTRAALPLTLLAAGCHHAARPPRPALAPPTTTVAAPIVGAVAPSDLGLEGPQGQRQLHYSGSVRLRVDRAREALDAVVAAAQARGGRLEHLTDDQVVVRVPVAAFAETWAEIRQLGEVLSSSQTSEVVTESFFAVDLRIRTLTVTRDRLVALMAAALDEQEKLALVHELQRVNEQLDRLEHQRRTLQDLADSSRITVQVVQPTAIAAGTAGPTVSGFTWIDGLTPFRRAIGDERRVPLAVPEGMVALTANGPFVAESPEGAALWTGRLANDPRSDGRFWVEAVIDRIGGDFASATVSTRGAWACVTLVDASEEPYTWEVCAAARPERPWLLVAEAYYPTSEAVTRYRAAVAAALGGAS